MKIRFLDTIISFLERNLLTCSWKEYLNKECMGCGMQRAILLLLKGEFLVAFKMYPALFTLIIMLVYLGFHLYFNFKYGHKVLLYLFYLNVVFIVVNYLLKII